MFKVILPEVRNSLDKHFCSCVHTAGCALVRNSSVCPDSQELGASTVTNFMRCKKLSVRRAKAETNCTGHTITKLAYEINHHKTFAAACQSIFEWRSRSSKWFQTIQSTDNSWQTKFEKRICLQTPWCKLALPIHFHEITEERYCPMDENHVSKALTHWAAQNWYLWTSPVILLTRNSWQGR